MWPDLASAGSDPDSGGEGEGLFFGLDLREVRDIVVSRPEADASLPAWWLELQEEAAEEKEEDSDAFYAAMEAAQADARAENAEESAAFHAAMDAAKADAIEEVSEALAAIDEREAIQEAREEAIHA
jgi:hypothetical protein